MSSATVTKHKQSQGELLAQSAAPGTVSAGAGQPVARAGDTTNHGGTITPATTGAAVRVIVGGKPVACVGDAHTCPMSSGNKPHVGGTIVGGAARVFVGGKPVARLSDATVCTAEPGTIAAGEASVVIG